MFTESISARDGIGRPRLSDSQYASSAKTKASFDTSPRVIHLAKWKPLLRPEPLSIDIVPPPTVERCDTIYNWTLDMTRLDDESFIDWSVSR